MLGCGSDTPSNNNKESNMFFKAKKESYVIFSPIEGVLLKNGAPLPNTKIIRKLRWNGNEDGLVEEFFTDEKGYFSLPIHEEELSLNMLSQFVGKADLEFETDTERDYIWTSGKFSAEVFAETAGKISGLVCDIETEEIAVPLSPLPILTKCRWKNMPE
jgi:hypothetical protein